MLLNKYKYSLNRGLQLNTEVKKKGIKVKSYAVISQATPVLYDISINAERNSFVLYNDHEYLHRECTVVTDSNTEQVTHSTMQILNEIRPHYCSSKNNFTVFIAN
jgi:Cys-tRNA synthase (O-phospho-L-seryl-tRNA:Cys-tRNA synthase)